MPQYLLGLDIGTSSVKAVLVDEGGSVVHTTAPEYPFEVPRPLWAEANPENWWQATVAAVSECLTKVKAEEIAGVGLTGQMHGLVLLDKEGKVLRPCIMWNDQRTGKQCAELTEKVGAGRVLELTGNPVLAGFTAPKILWVRENEPEVYAQAAKALLPKDYIRYRLSGAFFGEMSDASGTSLLDVAGRRWSDEMVEACGFPKEWLPELTEGDVASTKVSPQAALATGLKAGTPIAAGGGDQAAQAVGCGIIREGIVSATLGTSGVVFAASDSYRVEPQGRLHAFCHAVPGQWHLMGVMLSAAGSFQWFRDTFAPGTGFDELTHAAGHVPAGCEGLLFLPYLSGERTPHPDPQARGAFVGLTLRHHLDFLTRAVMEGVTYGLRDSLELMRALGLGIEQVIASGGGAKSEMWRQMMADSFHSRIVLVNATEGAAFGAALLAGVASGVYKDVAEACTKTLRETGSTEPGPDAAVYDDFYAHYTALYPALKDRFAALGETVEKHLG